MTLKQRLDAVWNDKRIACPNHLARWNVTGDGYLRWDNLKLYWKKGTSRKPKCKKLKGKGWTYLSKFYQIAWRCRHETTQKATTG